MATNAYFSSTIRSPSCPAILSDHRIAYLTFPRRR
jgi:hypothetical protein